MPEEQSPELQETPGKDVFISYASHDKAVAESVCKALEYAGLVCWIAPRDVVPGESFAGAIVRAIDATQVIVLVLSVHSASSQHVLREVERASSKRHPVIAFRIDLAPMPADFEYFLNTSQWLNASDQGVKLALPKLVNAVQRAIASVSAALPGDPRKPVASLSKQSPDTKPVIHGLRLTIYVLGALVALGLGYFALSKSWLTRHGAKEQSATTARNIVSDKSIAVLPFADMSEKKDQEYFADGMAEEILDLLAKIPGLTVIGRTSSFSFKNKNEDLRTIGAKLNAAYVLEGSVRKSGDAVRITAQLINAHSGTHEWSETYDRPIGDVLKLQDAIAAAVARELQLTVASEYLSARSQVKNVEAYDLILRARHAADRYDKEGLDEALMLLKQARDHDPTSADATSALAWAYASAGEWQFMPPGEAFTQARSAAAATLKLDANNVAAHQVLGRVHLVYDWDWSAAEHEFNQVATRASNNGDALVNLAALSMALGHWDDALARIKAATALDPLDPATLFMLATIQVRCSLLPEAEETMRRALDISPTMGGGRFLLGVILLARGDRETALLEMQRDTTPFGREPGLAIAYHALGRKADSDAALERMVKEQADGNSYAIAEVYASRGQPAEAMRWLDRAYVQKESSLYFLKVDTLMRNVEPDPRYKAFLRKMNLPE